MSKTPIELSLEYRSQIMSFAAFWILCSHSINICGENLWTYLYYFKPLIAYGWGGIDIFFFLSGLGIGLSLKKNPSTAQFFSKRFNRIFPAFFIVVTVEHLLYNDSILKYFWDVTMLGYWTPLLGYATKNTFWYVSAAFAFYLLSYPYYKYYFSKRPLLSTLIISVIGFSLYYILPLDLFLGRIPIYFMGMFASQYVHKCFKIFPFGILAIAVYMTICYVAYRYGGRILTDHGLHFFAFIFITPGLVFLLAKCFSFLDSIKIGKLIVRYIDVIGRVSLEFYLVHWVLLCAIDALGWYLPWGVFILLSLTFAYMVHWTAKGLDKLERIRLKY